MKCIIGLTLALYYTYGPWCVFVNNRVKETKTLSATSIWRHVSSHTNPADLVLKGVSPKELHEAFRCPNGNHHYAKKVWSTTDFIARFTKVEEERKKTETVAMLIQEKSILDPLTYFSNYIK